MDKIQNWREQAESELKKGKEKPKGVSILFGIKDTEKAVDTNLDEEEAEQEPDLLRLISDAVDFDDLKRKVQDLLSMQQENEETEENPEESNEQSSQ